MEDVYWECFFNNAGVSGPSSKDYAIVFVKNKISQQILSHLNESHLKAMGIEAIGDIIRILKFIKDTPELEKSKNISKETAERFIEMLPVNESPKITKINKIQACSTYEKLPGCEVPVPIRRIVTPEIEGRYKINQPNKSVISGNTQSPPNSAKLVSTSNRIVILNDNEMTKFEPKTNTSVLKRLGQSIDKSSSANKINKEDDVSIKRKKLETVNNKIVSKRLFNTSLTQDSQTKLSLSTKNIVETAKGNVFLRLGTPEHEPIDNSETNDFPYVGVFKLPKELNTQRGDIEVRIGHTTDGIRKVEATSTTSGFQSKKAQSIRDRLGRR